jgi:uncharacterized membrane protein
MNTNRSLAMLFVALAAIATFSMIAGMGMMGPGMMDGYFGTIPANSDGWGLAMGLGNIAMVAFWAAIIVGTVLLVRALVGTPQIGPARHEMDEPLAILRRRYAAGEVDEPTYERMKHELAA